ncbi:MAG: hypothetical protein J5845_05375 [Lachnospiraceae bacterium]|nr:hypothetical protein [Lachnospiraceae bacterium]
MKKSVYLITTIILAAGILSACTGKGTETPTIGEPSAAEITVTVQPTEPPATPTPTPTSLPTLTPSPTPTPEPIKDLSEFDPKEFFSDVVFCGDSLLHLYRFRGGPATHPEIFGDKYASAWLTITNYCIRLAVKDADTLYPGDAACVPKYRGERVNLWEVIPQLDKKRVMMFFGLNDIGATGVDKFVEDYQAVIEHIRETSPDVKFYILSITPMRKDKQDGMLDNRKIRLANEKLQAMCEENGWTYVDVYSILCDADGNLVLVRDGKSLSDGSNVHLTNAGYVYWDQVLEQFAREELKKEYYEGR